MSIPEKEELKEIEEIVIPSKPIEKPKAKPKVDLKDTLEKLNILNKVLFSESGGHRWDRVKTLLACIIEDVETKLKE